MKVCEEYEELMGQALAEELSDADRAQLDAHLSECESCSSELASLQLTLEVIPTRTVTMPESLGPAIERQIRAARAFRHKSMRRVAGLAAAAAIAVLAGIGYTLNSQPVVTPTGKFIPETIPGLPAMYAELMDAGEYPKAFVWLQSAIEESPEHYDTPELHAQLAALAYDQLRWYPEAYDSYKAYRATHPEAFSDSPEAVHRFAVLDEAYSLDANFASLHEWDRVQNDNDLEQYAKYIEHYPGTLFASDAVVQIARLVAEDSDADSDFKTAAETALARLEHPVVVAQFKLELGRHYLHDTRDIERARTLFEDVQSSSVTVLAMAARESLADLQDN